MSEHPASNCFLRIAAAAAKSLQSCPTQSDPIDGSPPGTLKDKNDVFSLLVCLGYLGCAETKNQFRKVAYVPNAEIKAVLLDIVREQNWYERIETIKRSENLLKAIKELETVVRPSRLYLNSYSAITLL